MDADLCPPFFMDRPDMIYILSTIYQRNKGSPAKAALSHQLLCLTERGSSQPWGQNTWVHNVMSMIAQVGDTAEPMGNDPFSAAIQSACEKNEMYEPGEGAVTALDILSIMSDVNSAPTVLKYLDYAAYKELDQLRAIQASDFCTAYSGFVGHFQYELLRFFQYVASELREGTECGDSKYCRDGRLHHDDLFEVIVECFDEVYDAQEVSLTGLTVAQATVPFFASILRDSLYCSYQDSEFEDACENRLYDNFIDSSSLPLRVLLSGTCRDLFIQKIQGYLLSQSDSTGRSGAQVAGMTAKVKLL